MVKQSNPGMEDVWSPNDIVAWGREGNRRAWVIEQKAMSARHKNGHRRSDIIFDKAAWT